MVGYYPALWNVHEEEEEEEEEDEEGEEMNVPIFIILLRIPERGKQTGCKVP